MQSGQDKSVSRSWLRSEQRAGRRAARPIVLVGAVGIGLAIGQAWCAALLLAGALTGAAADWWLLSAGFGAAALLRAVLSVIAERMAFNAGAAARRRSTRPCASARPRRR